MDKQKQQEAADQYVAISVAPTSIYIYISHTHRCDQRQLLCVSVLETSAFFLVAHSHLACTVSWRKKLITRWISLVMYKI